MRVLYPCRWLLIVPTLHLNLWSLLTWRNMLTSTGPFKHHPAALALTKDSSYKSCRPLYLEFLPSSFQQILSFPFPSISKSFHFLQHPPALLSSPIRYIPLPLFQRLSGIWWSAHVERLWFPSSFPFISPVWSVSVINAGPGSTKGRERHRQRERERRRERGEEEGLERDREVAHGLPAAVNTQVGVGKREEVCHRVIYYTSFIRQQTKGQGTLRWALANDGKCKQS